MNIQSVIAYLNQTEGCTLNGDYYNRVLVWQDWWKGFYKPFHEFTEINGSQSRKRRQYSMKMAKKICEDWASILLNEKTTLTIDDPQSRKFVLGDEQTGGVLGDVNFWVQGNALVEKAFSSGTGAFVVKLQGMTTQDEQILYSEDSRIQLDYLTALNIVPLTVQCGRITEAAFVSEVLEGGKKLIYLETHRLCETGYCIQNRYFSESNSQLTPCPLPEGIAPTVMTHSFIPLFTIIRPNLVNSIEGGNGLGMSIFSQAIDVLMGVDLAFNNLCRDFKLGGKKVFYSADLLQRDENGNIITPDDIMQQLFVQMGDSNLDTEHNITEYNPQLRVQENKDGIQAQLDYLSFKCGLGAKHYQFNAGNIVTATQYMGDKQELIQNASKHYIIIEKALQELVRAILWAGKTIMGLPVNPDTQVTVNFEDSYIIDKEAQRMRDLQEMRDGILQRWEYRVKWYGEDELTAKKMVSAVLTDNEIAYGEG